MIIYFLYYIIKYKKNKIKKLFKWITKIYYIKYFQTAFVFLSLAVTLTS